MCCRTQVGRYIHFAALNKNLLRCLMNCISSFSGWFFFILLRRFFHAEFTKSFYRDTFYYNEPTQIISLWSLMRINDQKLCSRRIFIIKSVVKYTARTYHTKKKMTTNRKPIPKINFLLLSTFILVESQIIVDSFLHYPPPLPAVLCLASYLINFHYTDKSN